MKRILVATDLSARSDRALERAAALANEHAAHLTVIHVVDEDLLEPVAEAQEKAAREAIMAHIDALRGSSAPGFSVKVVFGRAHAAIVEASEKSDTDLVVLGLHREDALRDMFRGTTVERIIRAGNVPVLLVKDRVAGPYRRIMVAVDFSVYSRRAVAFTTTLAPEAELFLVHAYDVPFKGFIHGEDTEREVRETHERQLQRMIDEEMAPFLADRERGTPGLRAVMQQGSPHEVIRDQVAALKPDLLVLGTHGRTGVAHAVLGSVAEHVLNAPPCDVLAIKAW
jgi:nucleotide-binding universal stress UspA family protein